MPCRSWRLLDHLLGMEYHAGCGEPLARSIAEPRHRSFIVIELLRRPCKPGGRRMLYLLAKRGVDTLQAITMLQKLLGGAFEVAGLKDAEATTIQHVAGPPVAEGTKIIRMQRDRVIVLKPLCRTDARLDHRLIEGNRFTILLEPLSDTIDPSEVRARVDRLIPAYYGYQRFGTIRPLTHILGLLRAHDMVDELTRTLLNLPFPDESPLAIRERLAKRGVPGAYEARAARIAAKHPGRLRQVLGDLLRNLDYEALQALAFNLYLSHRIGMGVPLEEPLEGERIGREGLPVAIVPGKGYEPGRESRRIYMEALQRIGISLSTLTSLPVRGYWRPVAFRPEDVRAAWLKTGGRHLLALSFTLPRAMYATVVLREVAEIPY